MRILDKNNLDQLRIDNAPRLALRKTIKSSGQKRVLMVCAGTGCHSAKSEEIFNSLEAAIKEKGLSDDVEVKITGCFGFCGQGPIIQVYPDNIFYVKVTPADIEELVLEHLINNNPLERLLYIEPLVNKSVKTMDEMSYYKKQQRISLRNCGFLDPLNVYEYIANDGYQALAKAFTQSPQEIIETIKTSGLRGRGGGGFPTGIKWQSTHDADSEQKYIICNADEGDPGSFMDQSLLEGDAHSIIEAMIIAGYAVGANTGYVYIRKDYTLSVKRLMAALDQAYELGLLGENILNSGFDFKIQIKYGVGAFVGGEETAIMHSIEGGRGEPINKSISPTIKGLFGKPTLTDNVETLASIAPIILNGGDWYASIGTKNSKGTKIFALGGKIKNIGLAEVPFGTTIRELMEEIGGGIIDDKPLKAVQIGGPSGGFIPAELIDTPLDYEELAKLGIMLGSGPISFHDEDDCIVAATKFYLEFACDESCGKCTPCRIGTTRLLEMLEKITVGNGEPGDIAKLEKLSRDVCNTSLCGLGKTAPNPLLTSIKYFRDEYEDHINNKKCTAGGCKDLIEVFITDRCIGCTKCARVCPVDAITGSVKVQHVIDQNKCIKCQVCVSACPRKVQAIILR